MLALMERFFMPKKREAMYQMYVLNLLDKIYNLDWYSSASKNECTAAVGFKWMLDQGVEIVDYFIHMGVSAIFLYRKNLLGRMISSLANKYDSNTRQMNGTHKVHVHSKNEAKLLSKYKPMISFSLLLPELKGVEEMAANGLKYFNNTQHIVLYYEDVVKNHTKLNDVLDFLNLPRRKLESLQVKIHTKRPSMQIANWVDVYNTLKGTKYKRFLEGT